MNSRLETPTSSTKSKLTIYQMATISLMTALLCILGPMSIPIGAIPISFTNFVIYLTVYLLGTKLGTLSYLIYLLLGTAGLPVFSAYSGGLAKLAGPTGGYLIGFIFMSIISGIFIKQGKGKILMYALTACVFPFLIGDAVKILLASNIGPLIRSALQKAHLLESL